MSPDIPTDLAAAEDAWWGTGGEAGDTGEWTGLVRMMPGRGSGLNLQDFLRSTPSRQLSKDPMRREDLRWRRRRTEDGKS